MVHQQFTDLKDPNVQVMKSVLRSFRTSKNSPTFSVKAYKYEVSTVI